MPQAIPILIAAAAGAAGAWAAGATITAIVMTAVINAAFAGLGMLLSSKPAQQAPTSAQLPSLDSGGSRITNRSPDAPRPLVYGETRVQGTIVFMHTTGNNNVLHIVLALTGHKTHEIGDMYFDDTLVEVDEEGGVPSGKYAGTIYVEKQLGEVNQEAFVRARENLPDLWTEDHRGCEVAAVYMTLGYRQSSYPNGLPNIWFVVKGRELYDYRTDETAYSANAILAVADYVADRRYSLGAGISEQEAAFIAAQADICDEEIDKTDGTTEKRYEANGILRSDVKPQDGIAALLSACAGRSVYVGGKWRHQAGAWQTPEITFDENDLRGGYDVQNLLASDESFNAIKGKYSNPAKLWQPDDFPAITSEAYEAEDGGERFFKDIELPFTTSPTAAQRLARIDLRRGRQPLTMVWPVKLRGWLVVPGDVVGISDAQLGWTNKPFEVLEVTFVFGSAKSGPTGGPPLIGVDLKLRETVADIYDWNSSDEIEADPAPNTNLPNPFDVLPPSNLAFAETLYDTRTGGGVKARGRLSWDASPDAFVQSGGYYIPERKLSDSSEWEEGPPTRDTKFDWFDFDPGTYDFRLTAVNGMGAVSDPLTIVSRPVSGLAAAPSAPSGFTVRASGGLAVAMWDETPDLDVAIGGTIEIRHTPKTSGATWADGTSLCPPQPGQLTAFLLPLLSGTYMVKFRDASGTWSTTFASFLCLQSSSLTFAPLASVVEDPGFAGAKTNCVFLGDRLRLGGAALFSTIPLVSAVPRVGYFGGVRASGTYAFAGTIDLGSVKKVRNTIGLLARVVNVLDLVGARTSPISTWPSFAGVTAGGEADAYIEVRTTQDNPAGSPTWSAWARAGSADFEARAFEYRIQMISNDPSFDIEIEQAGAAVEEVA